MIERAKIVSLFSAKFKTKEDAVGVLVEEIWSSSDSEVMLSRLFILLYPLAKINNKICNIIHFEKHYKHKELQIIYNNGTEDVHCSIETWIQNQ